MARAGVVWRPGLKRRSVFAIRGCELREVLFPWFQAGDKHFAVVAGNDVHRLNSCSS